MIRSLFLALACSIGLFSQDLNGTFIGFNGGSGSVFQVDVGLSLLQNGYTSYGLHVSADSQPTINTTIITGPTTSMVKESAEGYSIGIYADFGRAILTGGANFVTEKSKQMQLDNSGFNNLMLNQEVQKIGGYVKIGYKIHHILFYGGYSSYYKATAGIGYIF